MTASSKTYEVIKKYEGLYLEAYLCPAGYWTIGYGYTRGVEEGMRISKQMAEDLLGAEVRRTALHLRAMLNGVELTQQQFDALSSLCYNLKGGPRQLPARAPKLYNALLAGDRETAAREFLDITKAGGTELAGLVRRRKEESELFLS